MKIYRTLPLLLAFIAMPIGQKLLALDLQDYCSTNVEQTNEVFLSEFPYLEYLETFSIKNIALLEQHRQFLTEQERDGDHFLFNVCEAYLLSYPVDLSDFAETKEKIKIGETFLNLDGILSSVYPAMGDFLLSTVTQALQDRIKDKSLDPKSFEIKYLLTRLEDNLYAVDVPMSNKDKFLLHAKQGNWGYIWSRVRARYLEEFIFLLTMGIFAGGLIARFFIKRQTKKSSTQKKVEI